MLADQPLRREQLALLLTIALLTALAWRLALGQMTSMGSLPGQDASAGTAGSAGSMAGMTGPAGPMAGMTGSAGSMAAMVGSDSAGSLSDGGAQAGPVVARSEAADSVAGAGGATTAAESAMVAGSATGSLESAMVSPTSASPLALGLFLGMWVSMMVAMMLPSAAPMVLTYASLYRRQRERGGVYVPTWVFVLGYFLVWTAFGLAVWTVDLGTEAAAPLLQPLLGLGPRLAALALVAAGLYQLTPFKEVCLRHCRSPLAFVLHHWRPGLFGALRMGVEHGAYCVGCCWLLMVLLVAVGLASVPWMGVVTLIILAEKVLPAGRVVRLGVAGLLLGLGLLTLARPELLTLSLA